MSSVQHRVQSHILPRRGWHSGRTHIAMCLPLTNTWLYEPDPPTLCAGWTLYLEFIMVLGLLCGVLINLFNTMAILTAH